MGLIRTVHTYAALVTFANFTVYSLVVLGAALALPRTRPAPVIEYQDFAAAPDHTDRQVAEQVVALLGLGLATPIQQGVIQRDPAGNLLLDFRHANGRHLVTVLPAERRLRVEIDRSSLWRYLTVLHMTTGVFRTGDKRMHLWAVYNEFALWGLVTMVASGGVLVVMTLRKRAAFAFRTVHRYIALATLPMLGMYAFTAIRLAHGTWLPAHDQITEQSVKVTPGLTEARAIARELPVKGDLMNARPTHFQITRPGIYHTVDYAPATGEARIQTRRKSWLSLFNDFHGLAGKWDGLKPQNVWALVLPVVACGFFVLGVTGLYLWFQNHRQRRLGALALLSAMSVTIFLAMWMRGA